MAIETRVHNFWVGHSHESCRFSQFLRGRISGILHHQHYIVCLMNRYCRSLTILCRPISPFS